MLGIKFIRQNPEIVKKAVKDKRIKLDIDHLLKTDENRRFVLQKLEDMRAEQNKKSKEKQKPEEIEKLRILKSEIKETEDKLKKIDEEYDELINLVPNIPSDDTPIGEDESGNRVIKEVGEKPFFNFNPKEHWEIGKNLDLIDTETAAEISGARFGYIKRELALMEFSLIQFALTVLTDRKILEKILKSLKLDLKSTPFIPIIPPVFIKPEPFKKMARLEPKEERYYIPSDDVYLIGSAEHTLGSMHINQTFNEKDLPLRYVGFSTAFRREAGSYGKDMKGILRVHQFDKLEIESFTLPENAVDEQNFIVALQEYFMKSLELPYRVVQICTGDMGGPDARQIDIETWLPGQNRYRETHTSDMMTDYQSRRLNTKVRRGDKSEYVHMNDATVFAIGRTLIAIIENNQTERGTVRIPKVLQKYMGNIKEISRD